MPGDRRAWCSPYTDPDPDPAVRLRLPRAAARAPVTPRWPQSASSLLSTLPVLRTASCAQRAIKTQGWVANACIGSPASGVRCAAWAVILRAAAISCSIVLPCRRGKSDCRIQIPVAEVLLPFHRIWMASLLAALIWILITLCVIGMIAISIDAIACCPRLRLTTYLPPRIRPSRPIAQPTLWQGHLVIRYFNHPPAVWAAP